MSESGRAVVSGSSGLIGRRLVESLRQGGWRVDPLVRRAAVPGTSEISWDPDHGEIAAAALEGSDAVVHLAGESVARGRWNAERKQAILDSRVRGTRLLAGTLAHLSRPPTVFVSASAIGYYGDRGVKTLTESSSPGDGFLAEVCRAWEGAADLLQHTGTRVVNMRIGVVLSGQGGALARMLPVFRYGLGGRLGHGRQFVSWIALTDLVRAIEHVIATPGVVGPVNAVAPEPVSNAEFTRALGRVLRRPTVCRVPARLVRWLLGEMGEALLLASARVEPVKLVESGFAYRHADIENALLA